MKWGKGHACVLYFAYFQFLSCILSAENSFTNTKKQKSSEISPQESLIIKELSTFAQYLEVICLAE